MMELQRNWRRRIILFVLSQCITLFGSQIVQMAIIWYVTLQTNSGAWVAAFSVCSYIPQFFVSFIGGVLSDRCNRKHLIIGADVLIATVTLAMMLFMPYITAEPALLTGLLLLSVIRSAGAGVQNPAVNAVIPQLVPGKYIMRYNGMNAAMQSAVQFGAPAVAAIVLTMGTLRTTLLIDIITAVIGIAVLSFTSLPKHNRAEEKSSVLMDIGIGMRYAYSCMPVRKTLIVYGMFVFFTVPAGYLSGLLVTRVFGDTYWYLTAVELVGFGGMMLGGLLMSVWGGLKSRILTLAAGLAMFGAMAIGMGVSHHFWLYLVLMALYGVALTAVQTTVTTLLQENANPSMQGRVFGLMSSLYSSCYPIGMALFGPLADAVPLQGMMILSGAVLITVAGAAYWSPMR